MKITVFLYDKRHHILVRDIDYKDLNNLLDEYGGIDKVHYIISHDIDEDDLAKNIICKEFRKTIPVKHVCDENNKEI